MTHLDIIREAYDRVGIAYVVRTEGEWSYLFVANERERAELETTSLARLTTARSFMEFRDGEVASC